MSKYRYNLLDRLLHRLALQFNIVAEMSYDLDQFLVQADQEAIVSQRHVFISGLARAGTTVLMRRFHSTGFYRSLTYRDMPFVMAPNLWKKFTQISKREVESIERAHGDNLLVNADSPESLDEVFWRVFAGSEYLKKNHLIPHEPSEEIVHKYIRYVNAILTADSTGKRLYLSKNNNNILRLQAIHRAFPNALIVIPFREPLQHALSLLRQHCRFSNLQKTNKFTLSYMTWLGHYEFGNDHRPFLFGDTALSHYPINTLNYWIRLWCNTYEWLENSKPKSALFVCYEDLCVYDEIWDRLSSLADISINHKNGDQFKLSSRSLDVSVDHNLADYASRIYNRLVRQARSQLSFVN